MRKYIILAYILCIPLSTYGQEISTVAGVLETPGFNDGPALSARFFNPHGIATDSSGNVYIADRYNHTIRKLSPAGTVSTVAGVAGQSGSVDGWGINARFNEPWGICALPDGTLYVADTRNNKIRHISPDGEVNTLAGSGNFGTTDGFQQAATFGNPTGIEFGPDGYIYVADHLTHIIRKLSQDGWVSTLAGTPYIPGNLNGPGNQAQFWRPYGLTIDLEGNIIVADEWNHLIRKVTPDGIVSTLAGSGIVGAQDGQSNNASFNYPWDMTVAPDGSIYVADGYNYLIRKISTDSLVSTMAGTILQSGGVDGEGIEASFSGATSIVHCSFSNSFYIADAYNHLIRQMAGEQVQINLIHVSNQAVYCPDDQIEIRAIPPDLDNYQFWLDGEIVQVGSSSELTLNGLDAGAHTISCQTVYEGVTLSTTPLNIQVSNFPEPVITIVGLEELLPGDTTTLIASGGTDYSWTNGMTGAVINITEAGTYQVEATNTAGCVGTSNPVTITEGTTYPAPSIWINGDSIICPGSQAIFQTDASGNILWYRDGWPIPGATESALTASIPGYYQVQITFTDGVTAFSTTQSLAFAETIETNIVATPNTANPGVPVSLYASGENLIDYEWELSGPSNFFEVGNNPVFIFEQAGWYDVLLVVSSQWGCTDSIFAERLIYIQEDNNSSPPPNTIDTDWWIPTAFTPNGDGQNDYFQIVGNAPDNYQLNIYDQWGGLLFAGNAPWDGLSTNGQSIPNGTYTYLISWNNNNSSETISGHITLLR